MLTQLPVTKADGFSQRAPALGVLYLHRGVVSQQQKGTFLETDMNPHSYLEKLRFAVFSVDLMENWSKKDLTSVMHGINVIQKWKLYKFPFFVISYSVPVSTFDTLHRSN